MVQAIASEAKAESPAGAAGVPVRPRCLLFTAFEPSGDDHASTVIAELRRRHPDLPIFAWGGPKMARAGATLVERTGDDAVMGVPGIAKIREHQLINQRIEEWLDGHEVLAHVPVDSPAANFPICQIAKGRGIKVVHLVAPQIWAWGRWRIHKLRRRTDMVLCLLPFEKKFFTRRKVPARFIGHMLFDKPLDLAALDRRALVYPDGSPRIAMMPGSRPEELERNFPILLETFRALRAEFPKAVGVVAATNEHVATRLREMAAELGGWPSSLALGVRDADAIVRWCDIALVKSGTVTLQVCKQQRPMVIFYRKSNPILYYVAKVVLATKKFALPNIIAGREIVPELIPLFGGSERLIRAARELINNPRLREKQRREQAELVSVFTEFNASRLAADAIEEVAGLASAPRADAEIEAMPLPRAGVPT